jgi:hypothetical protein
MSLIVVLRCKWSSSVNVICVHHIHPCPGENKCGEQSKLQHRRFLRKEVAPLAGQSGFGEQDDQSEKS